MSRAHISKPILDAAGNVRAGASVRVLQPGTLTPLTGPLFAADMGSSTVTNPFIATNGVVDFYLDIPQRVRIGVTVGQEGEVFFEDVDVLEPSTGGGGNGFRKGASNGSVIGGDLDTPATANGIQALTIGDGAVGSGEGSVAVGSQATASGINSVAVGSFAPVDFDDAPVASGDFAIAIGGNATATTHNSTAVGNGAHATGYEATSVGAVANSSGDRPTALGARAQASADKATAVGNAANASGTFSTVAGAQAQAYGNNDTVVGAAARTANGGTDNTILGHGAGTQNGDGSDAVVHRSFIVGAGARVTTDDTGILRADTVEITPSSSGTTPPTALILHDSAGARWKVTVDTTGHLTTTAL